MSTLSHIVYLSGDGEDNTSKNKTLREIEAQEKINDYNRKEAASALAGSIVFMIISAVLLYGVMEVNIFIIVFNN